MAVLNQNYQKIGEAYLGNSGGNFYVRIYAKLNSQDIEANTSSVTYQSRLAFTGSYIISQGQTRVVTSGTSATTTTTNWQNFEGRKDGYFYNGETVVKTITGTVNHDNSTGVASISASAVFSSAGSWGWSGIASGTADLPTIPRNSTITATSPYVGETSQLTVTRYRDTYTHSIHYTFGSLSGYILANGSTTSTETKLTALNIGFPIPTSWYAQMPNDSEKICTLLIKTYNGDTQIGNDYTTTFYVRVNPTTNKPTVTASVSDVNDTTYNLTGNRNILVKGVSTASVTWSATAKNSATIKNVKINGTTVTTSPYNFTLNSNAITVVATDSRDLPTTLNVSFTLKDYFNPSLTISSIYRANPTDNFATVKFTGSFFNQSFGSQSNSLTINWKYRESGTTNWANGGNLTLNTHYKSSGNDFWSGTGSSASEITVGGSLLSYEKNWDILFTATDRLKSYQAIGSITKGIPIINWGEDFFNVNGEIRQNNVNIFNNLQTKPITLFSGNSTASSITLSDNVSNYKVIIIELFTSDCYFNVICQTPFNKQEVGSMWAGGGYIRGASFILNGTALTFNWKRYGNFNSYGDETIAVTKVLGYK